MLRNLDLCVANFIDVCLSANTRGVNVKMGSANLSDFKLWRIDHKAKELDGGVDVVHLAPSFRYIAYISCRISCALIDSKECL